MRTDEGDLTMTETTVSRSLSEIALAKKAEQLEIISKMSSSNKNEIKARKIAMNVFDNGYKFVGMKFSDAAFEGSYTFTATADSLDALDPLMEILNTITWAK